MIIPTVIDSSTRGAYDIYSLLLKERIVYLGTAIDENVANLIVAQLLYLDSENHNPIMLCLNSPGGIVYGGFAIYDTMRKLKSPVVTVAMGFCGSMSTVLLTAGQKKTNPQLKFKRTSPVEGKLTRSLRWRFHDRSQRLGCENTSRLN